MDVGRLTTLMVTVTWQKSKLKCTELLAFLALLARDRPFSVAVPSPYRPHSCGTQLHQRDSPV